MGGGIKSEVKSNRVGGALGDFDRPQGASRGGSRGEGGPGELPGKSGLLRPRKVAHAGNSAPPAPRGASLGTLSAPRGGAVGAPNARCRLPNEIQSGPPRARARPTKFWWSPRVSLGTQQAIIISLGELQHIAV